MATGRFPDNGILSLLGQRPIHDLSGSTSQNFCLRELMDPQRIAKTLGRRMNYGSEKGHPGLRRAIASDLGVSEEHILTTPGSTMALFMIAFELFNQLGDVVIPTPAYPATVSGLKAVGANIREVRLSFDRGYQPDIVAFGGAITRDTRLVSLASPQSPSGVCYQRDVLGRIHDVMRAQAPDSYFLVDEAYRYVPYGDRGEIKSYSGASDRVITTGSLSKAHGAPGLRVGWICTTDSDLMAKLINAKLNIFDCCSVVDEEFACEIATHAEALLTKQRLDLTRKRALVEKWVKAHAALVDWVPPDAGGLCCIRLTPAVFDDDDVITFYQAAADTSVAVGNGSWFGESDRIFRLGFGALTFADLAPALEALGKVLHKVAKKKT